MNLKASNQVRNLIAGAISLKAIFVQKLGFKSLAILYGDYYAWLQQRDILTDFLLHQKSGTSAVLLLHRFGSLCRG
jgi:hypothetical protein